MEQSPLTLPQALVKITEMVIAEHQRTTVSFGAGMLWIMGLVLFSAIVFIGVVYALKRMDRF
jgi:hypothetical protein